MEIIKKHKFKIIFLITFVVLILLSYSGIKHLLYPDFRKSLYGNRLEGLEEHKIEQSRLKEINELLINEKNIESLSYNITGRIINFKIKLDGDVDLITSQSYADKILENFKEEEKQFYDFQVYLYNDVEDSQTYPKIGYKHKASITFKWTN